MHDIPKMAQRQLADYRRRQPGTLFADQDLSLDAATAYHLQDAVTALRIKEGDIVTGYKVGCTGPGTRSQFGMDGPIRGTLFAGEVRQNDCRLQQKSFCHLAVEGEMAIKIAGDGQIIAAFPVIELHNFVFRSQPKTLSELIANNGINAGIILPGDNWQTATDLIDDTANLSVHVNGVELGRDSLWPTAGGPAASLHWLKAHLDDFDIALRAGQIVLAGTNLGLYPVQAGDRVEVAVNGQPAVSCTVV